MRMISQRFFGAVTPPTSGRGSGTNPSRFGIFTVGKRAGVEDIGLADDSVLVEEVRRHRVDLIDRE